MISHEIRIPILAIVRWRVGCNEESISPYQSTERSGHVFANPESTRVADLVCFGLLEYDLGLPPTH